MGAPAAKPAGGKGKDDKGKDAAAVAPAGGGGGGNVAPPKNKEEVLAQVNLDGLPHCPNEQIIEILKECYETLVSVFIHYSKQSECKTVEQATRLRLGGSGLPSSLDSTTTIVSSRCLETDYEFGDGPGIPRAAGWCPCP